ncbi:hypothetical protein EUX98_g6246 [Antrodiella citrinella]|uniref:BTB domain-containing protein n=1 Tax=Antrodiella citrinella TaxID=2447956 RepID=A0A4S4MPQ7_9APHY|nr:hypothetical protein EUX98_g6246 [Antrodiella citrinella]
MQTHNPPGYTLNVMPGAAEAAAEIQHADGLWFASGNLVLQVGNKLYKLHSDILGRHSDTLYDILGIPQDADSDEGTMEDQPVVVPIDPPEYFLYWVSWVYGLGRTTMGTPAEVTAPDLESTLGILHVSDYLQATGSAMFAVNRLAALNISPIVLLELARKYSSRYGLDVQVGPAIRSIMARSIQEITVLDFHRLDEIFLHISKTKIHILEHRCMVAFNPPGVGGGTLVPKGLGCTPQSHVRCVEIWGDVWVKKVMSLLLSYIDPCPLSSIADRLINNDHWWPAESNLSCKDEFIGFVAQSLQFRVEDDAINQLVQRVQISLQ